MVLRDNETDGRRRVTTVEIRERGLDKDQWSLTYAGCEMVRTL